MTEEKDPFAELQSAYQAQPVAAVPVPSREELEARAKKFARQVWWRNAREWIACVFVLFFFGRQLIDPSATRLGFIGNLVIVIATLFVGGYLYARGRTRRAPLAGPTTELLEHHASDLERQARLLRMAPFWYFAPLGVGLAISIVDTLRKFSSDGFDSAERRWIAMMAALVLLVFVGGIWMNLRGAKKLARDAAKVREGLS
ncbi:MAG: hypothetical protein HOV80_19010 [Polyangiaceae bacterium]|nr:hypothetical protein [Polyangiaceae bacterium]